MSKYQFPDPLTSDRSLNAGKIDVSGIDYDQNTVENSISLYDAFSFSHTGSQKIAAHRSNTRLRNLKGNLTIKNHSIFELMKLLSLCENRYKVETTKLSKAISRTIFINTVGIVGLIASMRPLIKNSLKCLKCAYLYRWKSNSSFKPNKRRVLTKALKGRRFIGKIRKIFRRKMIKYFVEVREKANSNDIIKKRRPSVKSPGDNRIGSNLNKSISSVSGFSDRQVDDKTKKEFKQSIQNRYKPENKPLERAMGSSYFRNK